MGDEDEFAADVIRDLEPVELFKDGGYTVTQAGLGEKAGGGILKVFMELSRWESKEQAISVVESGGDKCVDEYFDWIVRGKGGGGRCHIGEKMMSWRSGCFEISLSGWNRV